MHRLYNPNPFGARVGDCTIRALTKALRKTWEQVYCGIALEGFLMGDMPSSNAVWGAYIKKNGFTRHIIPDVCPDCYTVKHFCEDHPKGVYVLCISGHVVAVVDGDYFDTWDSGDSVPLYYWERSGN